MPNRHADKEGGPPPPDIELDAPQQVKACDVQHQFRLRFIMQ
jgi:hypothetical protein